MHDFWYTWNDLLIMELVATGFALTIVGIALHLGGIL